MARLPVSKKNENRPGRSCGRMVVSPHESASEDTPREASGSQNTKGTIWPLDEGYPGIFLRFQ